VEKIHEALVILLGGEVDGRRESSRSVLRGGMGAAGKKRNRGKEGDGQEPFDGSWASKEASSALRLS
jgi:hypothetical protein